MPQKQWKRARANNWQMYQIVSGIKSTQTISVQFGNMQQVSLDTFLQRTGDTGMRGIACVSY